MKELVKTNEVFTPSTPAKLTFVERKAVNTQIVNALCTPGKQIVLYGHSGCGKTTLIVNKLQQVYERDITVRCNGNLSYEEIVLQAFDELNPYYKESSSSTFKESGGIELKTTYLKIKDEISNTQQDVMKRVLPPTLTMQTLARFLGNAKCCLVLEDFHKIKNEEKVKIAQTMKLFMDMAVEYPEVKIICIGAVDTGREVVEYDPELKDRVAEIHVPLMIDEEILQIINKGFDLLNLNIPEFLKDRIVKLSNGVASVCHAICLQTCFSMGVMETQKENTPVSIEAINAGIQGYIQDASDSIQADFEKALVQKKGKYKNAELIFKALASFEITGAEYHHLLEKIKENESTYPPGNLSSYLKELSSSSKGAIIIKRSGKFCFKSPIYRSYAQILFNKEDSKPITADTIRIELQQIREKIDYLKNLQ